jgi:outer membrane biosynthesis protein TonB
MLPIVPLDGRTNIPASLPLESIAARVVVPRDVNREAIAVEENVSTPVQPTDLDERIAIPVGTAAPETLDVPLNPPEDLVDPDVFMTGEVNLLAKPPAEDKAAKLGLLTRFSSMAFHAFLVAFILLMPKIFPPHQLTQQEIDLANRQLTWIPPESSYSVKPKPAPRPVPPPAVHVDPRILRDVVPPIPQPAPKPEPERPKKDLPDAPIPKPEVAPAQPQQTAPKPDTPKPPLKLETPDMPRPQRSLVGLPKTTSPSQNIQDSLRSAERMSGPRPIAGGGQIPSRGIPGGGGSGGTAYGGLEMLTPDQGVDFNSYLQRVYVTVKRNWFAVMPESVELGERGIVVLTFKIMRDGSVPTPEPTIWRNSGKEPLDRAAYSSVRASSPFEPLPAQFNGPYIELRYTYLYNINPSEYFNH